MSARWEKLFTIFYIDMNKEFFNWNFYTPILISPHPDWIRWCHQFCATANNGIKLAWWGKISKKYFPSLFWFYDNTWQASHLQPQIEYGNVTTFTPMLTVKASWCCEHRVRKMDFPFLPSFGINFSNNYLHTVSAMFYIWVPESRLSTSPLHPCYNGK